jgi:hypothetical protein
LVGLHLNKPPELAKSLLRAAGFGKPDAAWLA